MDRLYLFFSCVCLLVLYLLSGIHKVMDLYGTAESLHKKINMLPRGVCVFGIVLVILLEIVGGSIVLFAAYTGRYKKLAYYAVLGFILFNIVATLIFHFPTVKGNENDFLKNLSITGGFLLLLEQFRK